MTELANKWRTDIGALRGFSVLIVVLCHSSVPGFSFGFIGVDFFFVISGYLITRSLYIEYLSSNSTKNTSRGSIKILGFYLRRIRRLLPAAVTVILITNLLIKFFFNPPDQISLVKDSIASLFFSANIHFIAINVDYFNLNSSPSFLQHFWSLSVEEQFYLLIPLTILLCAFTHRLKFQQKYLRFNFRLLLLLSIISIGSFLLLQINFSDSPIQSYFSLLFRAWELGVGAIFGILAHHKKNSTNFSTIEKMLPLIISIVVCAYLISSDNWARLMLLPVVATGFFLYAGENQGNSSHSNERKQSIYYKWLLFLGKISYSLYLVHWPVILITNQIFSFPKIVIQGLAICLSIILGNLLWKNIEMPFQRIPITKRLDTVDALIFDWARKRGGLIFGLHFGLIFVIFVTSFPTSNNWLNQNANLGKSVANNRFLEPFADYEDKLLESSKMEFGSELNSDIPQIELSNTNLEELQKILEDLQRSNSIEIKNAQALKTIPAGLRDKFQLIGSDKNSFENGACPNLNTVESPSSCIFLSPNLGVKKRVVIVGDSKISQLVESLNDYFLPKNWDVYTYAMNGCNPLAPGDLKSNCKGRLNWVAKQIESNNFDLLIFAGYPTGNMTQESQIFLSKLIRDSKTTILLGVTARTPDPTKCIDNQLTIVPECNYIYTNERNAVTKISSMYTSLQSSSVAYMDTTTWSCINNICPIVVGQTYTTRDGSHLTYSYVKKIEPIFYANLDVILASFII